MSGALILRIALGVLVPICAALVVVSVLQARDASSGPSTTTTATVAPVVATVRPEVAVVAARGSDVLARGWSSRLGSALQADVTTSVASDPESLQAALRRVTRNADVVVIVGDGLLTGEGAVDVAASALGTAHVQSPYATLALIGPGPDAGEDAGGRAALAGVARSNDARWIDPVDAGWRSGPTVSQMSAAVHPLLP